MAPQPVVTGLSPKEGPPGTRVIIRGEFLGTKAEDLIGKELFFSAHFSFHLIAHNFLISLPRTHHLWFRLPTECPMGVS